MNINEINSTKGNAPLFKGKRIDRNAVSQLIKNNSYSLSEPNQRYISNAITALSKVKGVNNIEFLMDSAAKVTYATNIHLENKPKNDWRNMLLEAAAKAAKLSGLTAMGVAVKELSEQIKDKSLTDEEKEILDLRNQLLDKVDTKQIEKETKGTTKDFKRNLDYLIISSETTLEHKKYILNRMNYFMSEDYEINPQLKDKKSIALAEIVNDLAIAVPDNKIPNIKAINQHEHGICAAISIVRKKLAYEDKPNYVDSLISELDASSNIQVYNRNKLGSGEKILLEKIPVNYDYALQKGYRIIDASAMHWMQIADMNGASNISFNYYKPFDKENFDVKNDTFFNASFEDEELSKNQIYLQALLSAKEKLDSYKAKTLKNKVDSAEIKASKDKNIQKLGEMNRRVKSTIKSLNQNISDDKVREIFNGILSLEQEYSYQIKPEDKFSYIENEEDIVKKSKVKNYLLSKNIANNISDETIDSIFEDISFIKKLSGIGKSSASITSDYAKARTMYPIAAAFRYQVVQGLNIDNILNSHMFDLGLPDKESIVSDTIGTIIEKLKKNAPDSKFIMEQAKDIFNEVPETREEFIERFEELKNAYDYQINEVMEELYNSLAVNNRKEYLKFTLYSLKMLVDGKEKETINYYSNLFNVKPKNVSSEIDKLIAKLENGDKDSYLEVYRKMGNVSQMDTLNTIYKNFIEQVQSEDNSEIVTRFLLANGLPLDDNENVFINRLSEIENAINVLNSTVKGLQNSLTIKDDEGNVLISANPKDLVLKKLENDSQIVSEQDLKILQEHLALLSKMRTNDEEKDARGRFKDKSVYEFSKREKNVINMIDDDMNGMYQYIKKQFNFISKEMKEPLEELKRIIGVNNGHYWVHKDGGSGLLGNQQIRILEYMTGRPHYETRNYAHAIEKIKTTPYSGISTSSVYHTEPGMHAQYVADIAPVKVITKGKDGKEKIEYKDVLFNDNTWGASEHENTWIDSMGLTRTDYGSNRGGSLGYITNENYQNGNLVERILGDMVVHESPDTTNNKQYKRIKHIDGHTWSFPQYSDIILDGKSTKTKSVADSIHDILFVPTNNRVGHLDKIIKDMTESEILGNIRNLSVEDNTWRRKYSDLKSRIFANGTSSIKTQEDYDKLADNDYLKVALEKIALEKNYKLSGLEKEIASVKSVKELSRFRAAQKNRALNEIKYAFGKSKHNVEFLEKSYRDEQEQAIDEILKKHGIEPTDDLKNTITADLPINLDKMNGSLAKTIDIYMEALNVNINKAIDDEDANIELKDYFRKYISDLMYFNKEDLVDENDKNMPNRKISNIIEFIDRVYDPIDDEEFVKIYRKIQNMTTAQFNQVILPKLNHNDLGIKDITGYDILKKIQRYEEQANTDLLNRIWYDTTFNSSDKKEYSPYYEYNKLSRKTRFRTIYNFNTSYKEILNDIEMLTFEKLFNKYKADGIKKYGAYPAYPKANYMTEEMLNNTFNSISDVVITNTGRVRAMSEQIENYQIAHKLEKYLNKLSSDDVLTESQYKNINNLLGRLITLNIADESMEKHANYAEKALDLEKGTKWKEYIPSISFIVNDMRRIENTTSIERLQDVIDANKKELALNKKAFILTNVLPKHQAKVAKLLNDFEKACIDKDETLADAKQNDLYQEYCRYHLLQEPKELLNLYLRSGAKDSSLNEYHKTYSSYLTRAIAYASLIDIQETLMDAISKGVETDAKSLFDNYELCFAGGDYTMNSDEIIEYMVNKLIVDNQYDTALMFIEKLGLGDRYVKASVDDMDIDGLFNIINKTNDLVNNFNNFSIEAKEVISKSRKELVNNQEDYGKIISRMKRKINKLGKKHSIDDKLLKLYLVRMDILNNTCKEEVNADKTIIFDSLISSASEEIAGYIQTMMNNNNETLTANATIVNLINQIRLDENSEASKLREKLNLDFKSLMDYRDSLSDLQEDE